MLLQPRQLAPQVPFTTPPVSYLKLQDYLTSLVNQYGGVYWPLDDAANNPYNRVINTAVATGRDICINGTFSADVTWGKQAGATISGGVGNFSAVALGGGFSQPLLAVGRTYQVTFDLVVTSGTMRCGSGGSAIPNVGATRSVSGTYTDILIANSTTFGLLAVSATFTGTVDNVSVKELNIPAYNATPSQLLNTDVWNGLGVGAWTALNSAILSAQTTTRHDGISGTVLRVARGVVAPGGATRTVMTVGLVYRVYGWARGDGGCSPVVRHGSTTVFTGTPTTDWQPVEAVFVASSTDIQLNTVNGVNGGYVEFDVTVLALDTGIRQDANVGLDMNMEAISDSGTASAGASTTLTDASKTWVVNVHASRLLTIVSGTGAGQTRLITSNTATVITVPAWTVNPDNTSVYQIISYWVLGNNATITKDTSAPHSGSRNLRIARSTTTNPFTTQACLVTGKRYRLSGWYKTDGTATVSIFLGTNASALNLGATLTWTFFDIVAFANNANLGFQAITSTGTQYAEFDDITVTELSPLVAVPVNGAVLGNAESNRLLESVSFDGVNDLINLYSAQLNSISPVDEATLILFVKVSGPGIWTNGVAARLISYRVDANNTITIDKTGANNTLLVSYIAGGTTVSVTIGSQSSTGWLQVAITLSKSGNAMKAFINGSQVGSTQTGQGTWVGNLVSTTVTLGAGNTGASSPFSGFEAHLILLPVALAIDYISEISKLGDVS